MSSKLNTQEANGSYVEILDNDQTLKGLAEEADALLSGSPHWQTVDDMKVRYANRVVELIGSEAYNSDETDLGGHLPRIGALRAYVDRHARGTSILNGHTH